MGRGNRRERGLAREFLSFPFLSYLARFRFPSSPSQHPTTLSDDSENVTFETNKRLFKLCRVYSNSLKMSSVGKLPWS